MKPNPIAIQQILATTKNVKVVAATKYLDASSLPTLDACHIQYFGENRVQAFLEKYKQYQGQAKWHFIGHLQTNKVKDIITKVSLIHSVSSYHLIDEIQKQAQKNQLVMPILVEVNIANEASKQGFQKEEIFPVFEYLKNCPNIAVKGLMMMAPNINQEDTRPYFRQTKQLFDTLKQQFPDFALTELSMGMSNDYKIAIEEGATMVRIGRALFCDE